MRTTAEILADLEENGRPEYEELRMACLVQESLLYFIHNDVRRLLKGGSAAEITRLEYPDAHAKLGISKREWTAMRMDPCKYLGPDHIPGTPEWSVFHSLSKKILDRALRELGGRKEVDADG